MHRSRALRSVFPWFDNEDFGKERDAKRVRLTVDERRAVENAQSILRAHVLAELDRFTRERSPTPIAYRLPSTCFWRIRPAIRRNGRSGDASIGRRLRIANLAWVAVGRKDEIRKTVDEGLVRDIYEALERNGDSTATWRDAKHSEFALIFGAAPK